MKKNQFNLNAYVKSCENALFMMGEPVMSSKWAHDFMSRNADLVSMNMGRVDHEAPFPVDIHLHLLQEASWAHWGYNVFDLSESLTSALLLTEPVKLVDEPKFPFPSYMIKVPPGFLVEPDWIDSQYLLVSTFTDVNDEPGVRVMAFDGTHASIRYMPMSKFESIEGPNGTLVSGPTDWENEQVRDVTKAEVDVAKARLRIIRNLHSWLESKGGVQKAGTKRKSFVRNKKARATVWNIGREVKLAPQLVEQAKLVAVGKSQRPKGWEVRVKHVVRGHWKMQPHGPGSTERKRLWVMPYWRGPDEAEGWAHIYKAAEP